MSRPDCKGTFVWHNLGSPKSEFEPFSTPVNPADGWNSVDVSIERWKTRAGLLRKITRFLGL